MSETTSNDQGLIKKEVTNGADKRRMNMWATLRCSQEYGQKLQMRH